jgi:hypothetical protein
MRAAIRLPRFSSIEKGFQLDLLFLEAVAA